MFFSKTERSDDFYRRCFVFTAVAFLAVFAALVALGIAVRHNRSTGKNTNAVLIVSDLLALEEWKEDLTKAAVLTSAIEIRSVNCLSDADAEKLSIILRSDGDNRISLLRSIQDKGSAHVWSAKELTEEIRAAYTAEPAPTSESTLQNRSINIKSVRLTEEERIRTAEAFFGAPYAFETAGDGVTSQNLYASFAGRYGHLRVLSAVFRFDGINHTEEECAVKALTFAETQTNMQRCQLIEMKVHDGIFWAVVKDRDGRFAKIGVSSSTCRVCYYLPVKQKDDI